MNDIKSTLLENPKSTPLALSAQVGRCNQYITSEQITELAVKIYKTKGRRGITFTDLLESGLAEDKAQAQDMLKYHKRKGTLFTLEAVRPQQYYPTAIKSRLDSTLLTATNPSSWPGIKQLPPSSRPIQATLFGSQFPTIV